MKELETLLNSLIKMWWKPWGFEWLTECGEKLWILSFFNQKWLHIWHSLRELVSLESWLWQFCTEKGIVNIDERNTAVYRKAYPASETEETISSDRDYQYRLIESALVPEDKLGQFLLDNIIVEWTMNWVMKSC